MLGKLLGKKSGYYLELSEQEIDAIPEPLKAPVAAVAKAVDAAVDSAEGAAAALTEASAPAAPAIPALDKAVSKASNAMPQEVAVPEATAPDPLELIRTALATAHLKRRKKLRQRRRPLITLCRWLRPSVVAQVPVCPRLRRWPRTCGKHRLVSRTHYSL